MEGRRGLVPFPQGHWGPGLEACIVFQIQRKPPASSQQVKRGFQKMPSVARQRELSGPQSGLWAPGAVSPPPARFGHSQAVPPRAGLSVPPPGHRSTRSPTPSSTYSESAQYTFAEEGGGGRGEQAKEQPPHSLSPKLTKGGERRRRPPRRRAPGAAPYPSLRNLHLP